MENEFDAYSIIIGETNMDDNDVIKILEFITGFYKSREELKLQNVRYQYYFNLVVLVAMFVMILTMVIFFIVKQYEI